MSGQIDLEYPFVSSWLWETRPDIVWVSMVVVDENERNKGYVSKLIDDLMLKYNKVIVPNPSKIMQLIIEKRGFVFSPDYDVKEADVYHTWVWIKKEDEEK